MSIIIFLIARYSLVETSANIVYEDSTSGRGWKSYILSGVRSYHLIKFQFILGCENWSKQ
jgi:hypothetical protein